MGAFSSAQTVFGRWWTALLTRRRPKAGVGVKSAVLPHIENSDGPRLAAATREQSQFLQKEDPLRGTKRVFGKSLYLLILYRIQMTRSLSERVDLGLVSRAAMEDGEGGPELRFCVVVRTPFFRCLTSTPASAMMTAALSEGFACRRP